MVLWRRRNLHPPPGGSGTGSLLLHYFSTNRVDSRGLRWIPVDSTAANKRLTSNVLDHKLRVVSQLPKHVRMGSTPAATQRRAGAWGRASLRGAASHEAKGRSGAWSGGAGRVGPPTGWRLLRQIGDKLVPGLEQFLLVDDVVAVEDGPALVPGQEHGDALGDVRADQVTGGGAPAIVEEAGRHPGRLAGGAPRRAPAADRNAVAVEDERAGGIAARSPAPPNTACTRRRAAIVKRRW